jgi:hypothetical protein
MSWFDDARKKVDEVKDKATASAKEKAIEAQTEAAKRAAGAVLAEAGRRVGNFFEGFVSSAEDALQEARAERGLDGEDAEAVDDEPEAVEAAEPEPAGATPAERALAELRRMQAERGQAVAPKPAPAPAPEPAPEPEPEPEPTDPFAAARAALERSAAARAGATVNRRAQDREAAAREELARLKGQAPDDDSEPRPPKRRDL